MKILYFMNDITNVGGIERIVIDKINYLVDVKKFDISIAYLGMEKDKPFYKISSKVHLLPLQVTLSEHNLFSYIRLAINLKKKIRNLICSIHPDVIDNANTVIVSWILPFVCRNVPKIVELHFSYAGLMIMNKQIYHNNKILAFVNNCLRKFFYPRYDSCVVLTNDDKKTWKFKNMEVIPNYPSVTRASKEKVASRRNNTVIFVGRLEPQKDPLILIQAWAIVYQKHKDWNLELWGSGSLKNMLIKQVHAFGLDRVILFKGVSSHIESEYLKAKFFVLPSLYEGMPLCLLEAMQQGLPCISYNIAGVNDIISNGRNGFILKDRTPEALGYAINELIEDSCKLKMFSMFARKSIRQFDKAKIMKKWEDLFLMLSKGKCLK